MAYQYSDADQHEALYNVARRYPGSIDGLAHAMGVRLGRPVSAHTLRNKLRPGMTTHALNAEEWSLVVELCEEAKVEGAKVPLHALCLRHGMVAFEAVMPDADVATSDLIVGLGNVSREFADVVSAVTSGMADGRLEAAEVARIHKEAIEVVQAVMALTRVATRAAEAGEGDRP